MTRERRFRIKVAIRPPIDRPRSVIEEIGERCLQVVRDHADDATPAIRLIADFCWALGLEPRFALARPPVAKE